MIKPLRKRHLRLVVAVGLVVAPLAGLALARRPAALGLAGLPTPLAGHEVPGPIGFETELGTVPPVVVRRATGGPLVELVAAEPLEAPALLLYWTPATGTPLGEARLLGPFSGHGREVFELPEPALATAGELVLYSLGHGAELARVAWPGAESEQ